MGSLTEILTFNLKLLGRKSKKNILVTLGLSEDKEKILNSIKKLSELPSVQIYATEGTNEYLKISEIKTKKVYKILEKREPNVKSLLENGKFDLIINIMHKQYGYDEYVDSNQIKLLAVENTTPLITDVDVAVSTINRLVTEHEQGVYKYKIKDSSEPWNLKREFFEIVNSLGGFAIYHAHFDKAYLISKKNLKLGQEDMQDKWALYKYLKENYTHKDLVERISRGLDRMIHQGVVACRTFVDADSTVRLLPIKAALEVKKNYEGRIQFEIGIQPLEGLIDNNARKYFEQACEMADIIGGLPSKDKYPEKHLDIIMKIAKNTGKQVNVHVDQQNSPFENETELLALKTIEHGLEGRVSAIHALSLAAKHRLEQERILKVIKDAGLNIIVCPSAALSMKQLNSIESPIHNSIAPIVELQNNDIPVFLGVDNIYDLFMPLCDGDIYFECKLIMEACRWYDIQKIAEIACDKSGFNN